MEKLEKVEEMKQLEEKMKQLEEKLKQLEKLKKVEEKPKQLGGIKTPLRTRMRTSAALSSSNPIKVQKTLKQNIKRTSL